MVAMETSALPKSVLCVFCPAVPTTSTASFHRLGIELDVPNHILGSVEAFGLGGVTVKEQLNSEGRWGG